MPPHFQSIHASAEENDKELMREAIAQKPFAAKYGDSARVWATVAERVSAAIQTVGLEKQ
ncbi:hypothetical protein L916_01426, partial [Phytophthora nicotianae]